jgi:hypothetical protein
VTFFSEAVGVTLQAAQATVDVGDLGGVACHLCVERSAAGSSVLGNKNRAAIVAARERFDGGG